LTQLIISVPEWETLVVSHLNDLDVNTFTQDIVSRLGTADSLEDLNRWLQLAMNIWNTTPQPDRGGKSAQELSRRRAS